MAGSTGAGNRPVSTRKLWTGGAVAALVAALVAIVCILFARGVVGVAILAPKGDGAWGDASTVTYAMLSAAGTLVATGLFQLLVLATPRPALFFGWIMVLLTLIVVVLPLSLDVTVDDRVGTALLNLTIGLVITGLVNGVGRAARAPRF